MNYDSNIIKKLKDQIKKQINEFKYNQEIIDKLYKSYKIGDKRVEKYGTIIEIKNNKLNIEYMCIDEKNRTNDVIKLIEKSIEYIKKKNMNYPDTKLFL